MKSRVTGTRISKPEGREYYVAHVMFEEKAALMSDQQWSMSTTFFTEEEAKAYMQGIKDAS